MRTSEAATAVTRQFQLAPASSAPRRGSEYAQLSRQIEEAGLLQDRKSTRLNSSHLGISYAVFCLKKKNDMPLRHVSVVRMRLQPSASKSSSYTSRNRDLIPPSENSSTIATSLHTVSWY